MKNNVVHLHERRPVYVREEWDEALSDLPRRLDCMPQSSAALTAQNILVGVVCTILSLLVSALVCGWP